LRLFYFAPGTVMADGPMPTEGTSLTVLSENPSL
jgi:hypothetical protein